MKKVIALLVLVLGLSMGVCCAQEVTPGVGFATQEYTSYCCDCHCPCHHHHHHHHHGGGGSGGGSGGGGGGGRPQ